MTSKSPTYADLMKEAVQHAERMRCPHCRARDTATRQFEAQLRSAWFVFVAALLVMSVLWKVIQ